MKSNGKSTTPILAAHAKKNNGNKPAPPSREKGNHVKRVSRVSSKAMDKLKCQVLGRISDGIIAFDAKMNPIYVNERAGKILGREPQDLVGKNFLKVYPDLMGGPFVGACQRAFETQTVIPFNGYFAPSDTWLEARLYPSGDGVSVLLQEGKHPEESQSIATYDIYKSSQFPEQNPNPVMCFRRDGELLYANPASAPLLTSWKGQTRHNLPIELQELLFVVSETGSNQEIELENAGITYSCLLVPVTEPEYINLYFSDITERKQAEEALRISEEKYRRIVETANEGIWEIDEHTRTIFVNHRMAEMLGYTPEEMIGRSSFEFIVAEDYSAGEERLERARKGVGARAAEFRYRRKDGSLIWTIASSTPRIDEQGNFMGGMAMISDITERKQAEEEIYHLNAKLQSRLDEMQALLDILPTGVWIGNHDCSVITGNPAAYRIMGLPSGINASVTTDESQMPAGLRIFVNGEEVVAEDAPMQVVARSGKPLHNIEHELLFENGTRKTVFASIVPLFDNKGNVRQVIGAYADFTERKQIEQSLARERELLEKIFDSIPVMLTIYEPSTRVLQLNSQFEKLIGWNSQDAQSISLMETCYPDPEYREKIAAFIKSAKEDDWMDIQMQTREGRTLETSWSNIRISNDLQVGIGMDITERKQGERALVEYARQQSALYKLVDQLHRADTLTDVFDASLDAIVSSLQCDRASILLFDETKIMHFIAWRGLSDEYRIATDGHSPWKYGEENPAPIWYDDVNTSDLSDSLKAVVAKEGIGSLAFIPLVYQETLIGKFMVYYNTSHIFMENEINLALTIGRQLASAVHRKRAEERLRISEDRLRLAVTAGNIGIWDVDLVRRDRAWSKEGKAIYGLAEDEFLDFDRQLELTHPDDRDYVDQTVRAFRDQGTIKQLNLEHRILQPDGTVRWVELQGEAVYEDQPSPVRLIGTIVDITERKLIEDALRQSEERFAQFMQYLPGLAWIKDVQGRYVFANAAAEKAFATSRDELYGKTDTDVFAPEVAAQFKKNDDLALTEAKGIQVVETLVQDDEVVHYSLVTKFPIPGVDGKPALIGGTAFDVTEQRQMENALRESEERYRALVNQATAGIVRKDAEGRLMFVNDAFCEMLGYSAAELKEKTMWQITHPEDVSENRRLYNRLMTEGVPFQLEKRLIRRDGSILWATVSVSPVLDSVGKPQSAVSVYSDITLRRLAEAELRRLNLELEERVQQRTAELEAANEFLRESEATARLILESMPDAILIADKDGQIVYGNNQVESLFGYSPKDVIGQPVEMLIPERFHENHVGHRQAYNGQRQRRSMGLSRDMFGQRKDTSEFPVDVMLSPISNNTSWDVMVTIRDNTEQKQAQQALRANEEKLRKLFEILPVGVSFLNNEGHITEMNSALTQILGLSKRELLEGKFKPRQYIRSVGSPMPASEVASVRAHTEQKTIYNMETGIIKENGETIWTSVYAAPVNVAEIDIVVATIDITERKKAEEALHKNRERLRILSRRLVEVQEEERRALAHELHDRVGQNLAALNLNLNILRGQLSTEALQIIGSRLDDSVSLVNQILTITRNVMSDLRSNVLDDYGLESALREFADQFTLRTGIQVVTDKSVNLIPHLDSGIEMTLLRIAQEALTNVARHAQANQATISMSADGENVYMSIQDDGVGILSWQRANQPGSHGLRIIRERAEAFGGSLQIHSTYKKGTRLDVKIPLVSENLYKVPREKRS